MTSGIARPHRSLEPLRKGNDAAFTGHGRGTDSGDFDRAYTCKAAGEAIHGVSKRDGLSGDRPRISIGIRGSSKGASLTQAVRHDNYSLGICLLKLYEHLVALEAGYCNSKHARSQRDGSLAASLDRRRRCAWQEL